MSHDRFASKLNTAQGTNFWRRPQLNRRMFFQHAAAGVGGYFLLPSRPMETVAKAAPTLRATAKNVIFILMYGGPSQIDTFDYRDGSWMPPGVNPSTYGQIRWPQGMMPLLAEQLQNVVLVRSMQAWALVHNLARTWVQIGRNPSLSGSRIAPHIGSVVSMELGKQTPNRLLPAFLYLNSNTGPGAGYLPAEHSPFYVSPNGGGLANTTNRDGEARFNRRVDHWKKSTNDLRLSGELGGAVDEYFTFNDAARKLMYNSEVASVFTFDAAERVRYGNSGFGSSCITARNLLRAKAGVRFILINQPDWDHHDNIYLNNAGHLTLMRQFDSGVGRLIEDLRTDGLLDETLIVAMGEFGRTAGPLTPSRGRDHHLQQAALFAGGGVRGGTVIGSTDAAGMATREPGWKRNRPIRPEDVEATIYSALGIDYTTIRRDDPIGRGYEYVPFSERDLYGPIDELWG